MFRESLSLATYIRPFDRDIANGSGQLRRLQQIESLQQHTLLQVAVKRDAKVVAHGPRKKNCARRLDLFRHISSDGNRDGGYTASLNRTLDQSDGLMADRSSGDQQGDIGFLFHRNRVGDPVRDRALKLLRIHVVTDEAEEIPGQAAEHTLRR